MTVHFLSRNYKSNERTTTVFGFVVHFVYVNGCLNKRKIYMNQRVTMGYTQRYVFGNVLELSCIRKKLKERYKRNEKSNNTYIIVLDFRKTFRHWNNI